MLSPMKALLLATALAVSGTLLAAQEGQKPVPKDSARVTLTGCATGRTFIVGPRTEHGATNVDIAPGRRFRLNGKKEVLERIKSNEDRMVEVTGLIRRDDLKPRGVSLAGGRVKIGGADPRAPVGGGSVVNSPNYDQVTMDVESSRSLVEKCPA
jgi:hypothetical protein